MESGSCRTGVLSEEQLLSLCRMEGAPEVSPDFLADLRAAEAWALAGHSSGDDKLARAAAMAASALAQLNSGHVFSADGRSVPDPWINRDDLELFLTQLLGLLLPTHHAQLIRQKAKNGVWHATYLGWIESRTRDGWEPGMPSGSGRYEVVAVTAYGFAQSQRIEAEARPAVPTSAEPAQRSDSSSPKAAETAQAPNDSDEDPRFPAMQFIDEQGQYDFGGRRLLWELFRVLYSARKRLTPDELNERVERWNGSVNNEAAIKQAINDLRRFWRDEGRPDIADCIRNRGGLISFEHAPPSS